MIQKPPRLEEHIPYLSINVSSDGDSCFILNQSFVHYIFISIQFKQYVLLVLAFGQWPSDCSLINNHHNNNSELPLSHFLGLCIVSSQVY